MDNSLKVNKISLFQKIRIKKMMPLIQINKINYFEKWRKEKRNFIKLSNNKLCRKRWIQNHNNKKITYLSPNKSINNISKL